MPNAIRIPSLRLTELDGSPDIQGVERIYLTNTTLSNLGGGNALLSLSGFGTPNYTSAYASRPAATASGALFFPDDSFYIERDNGSAWIPWGPIFPMTQPVDGDFSWFNQGGASVSTTNGGIFLSLPSTATTQFRGRIKAKTAPYTITAGVLPLFYPANFVRIGIFFTDGTKTHVFGVTYNSSATDIHHLCSSKFTSATAISADYSILTTRFFGPVLWFRIADDNVNRICSFSSDGINFIPFHTIGRTDFLTATSVGFGGDIENSNAGGLTLLSWKET